MFRVPLVTNDQDVSLSQFWSALMVYHNRPHLVNRRIIGALQVCFMRVDFVNRSIKRITELLTHSALIYEIRKLKEISREHVTPRLIKSILEPYDKECELEECSIEDFQRSEEGTFVSLRILLPRQTNCKKCIEVVVFDKNENLNVVTFFAAFERGETGVAPPFPYDIEFVPPGIVNICIDNVEYAETSSADWLASNLFPKLVKWAEESASKLSLGASLSLVDINLYSDLYCRLKKKYGKEIIQIWPENTDPYKFVYEDVAIATYLIALWNNRDPAYKPSFVDLGCGNGLLVHILNQEGYSGYGIDVRKRKIWDLYPTSTNLKVQTITPSESFLFPKTDWLIGNHSDELTPWIPVITARSSHKANFFLLPCCSYEFDGKKYQRKNTSKSQYSDYLDYVERICETCGFMVARDKLRIPSTKRSCLVSTGRRCSPEEFSEVNKRISELLGEKTGSSCTKNGEKWVENFAARPEMERVRNCTKINRNVINSILKQVSNKLLSESDLTVKLNGEKWNQGKNASLPNLIGCISREDLKELKNECGGLQTLLKNHRYVFKIENGFVRFRIPPIYDKNNSNHKSKPCWFHENHPDGCYHSDGECSYKH